MDYEKKYNEALERARKEYNSHLEHLYEGYRKHLEEIFPELAESEDERIRKEIILHIKDQIDSFISAPDCRDTEEEEEYQKYKSWLAWLEKQKEPENVSATTMAPSCWEVKQKEQPTNEEMLRTLRVEYEKGVADTIAKYEQKEQRPAAEEILAKAGLKPYKDGNQWCILAGDNIQDGICGFGDTIDEALYQFLMEVLEKQKEQKPAEKSEISTNVDLEKEIIKYTDKISLKELNDLPYTHLDECARYFYKLGCNSREILINPEERFAKAREKYEVEWSEEDVKRLYSIGTQIGFLKGKYSEYQKDIDWLYALAEKMGFHKCKIGEVVTEWKKENIDDKMLSKPKQEWSEKDETKLDDVIRILEHHCGLVEPIRKHYIKFLKSLRLQPKRDGGDDYNKGYIKGRADTLKEFNDMASWKPREQKYDENMDKECIKLCDILNSIPSVDTFESCCGHLKDRYSVWFFCNDIITISRLGRCVERNYSDGKWELLVDSTDTHPTGVFLLRSKEPFQSYDEMEKSVNGLCNCIQHWLNTKFDSYFNGNACK